MSYIIVSGPDKVSINKFMGLVQKSNPKYFVGIMHSLMSSEAISLYLDDFTTKYSQGIIVYFCREGKLKEDPITCLPEKLVEKADVIVWFDIYSVTPQILKNSNGCLDVTINEWDNYIQKIS